MAASNLPIYPKTPATSHGLISAAVTGRTVTGTTGLTQVIAAGADGTRIDSVNIQATATTSAGMVRLWLYSGSGDAILFDEIPVGAVTPSGTVAAFSFTRYYQTLVLPTGYSIYASTNNAEAFAVRAFGGNY
jgi:hypothetical protein